MYLFISVRDHIYVNLDMCFHGLFCLYFSASTPALFILSHINLELKVNICLDFLKSPHTQSFHKQCTFPKEIRDKFILKQSKHGHGRHSHFFPAPSAACG